MGGARLAGGAVQPALTTAPAQGSAVRFGGDRPGGDRRGDLVVPRACRRPADRRRPFLRRPPDGNGRGRPRGPGEWTGPVPLPRTSPRPARAPPHPAPAHT